MNECCYWISRDLACVPVRRHDTHFGDWEWALGLVVSDSGVDVW